MDLTGWQSHSVRGFISAQLGKRMGFQIQSFKRDGERIYRIRSSAPSTPHLSFRFLADLTCLSMRLE